MSNNHQERIGELTTLLQEISNEIDRIQADKGAPRVLRQQRLDHLQGQYYETKGRLQAYGTVLHVPKPSTLSVVEDSDTSDTSYNNKGQLDSTRGLSGYTTEALVAELIWREGVNSVWVTSHQPQSLHIKGPARVITVPQDKE